MVDPRLDDLVIEATRRAYEVATVYYGREPTLSETTLILLQSQLALLAATIFQGDDLVAYWRGVIDVIRGGGVTPGMAS